MDDARFRAFLALLRQDIERAGWFSSTVAATYQNLEADVQPSTTVGLATRSSDEPLPDRASDRDSVAEIERVLDYTITAGGTAWIRGGEAMRTLAATDNRDAVRVRARAVIDDTPEFRAELADYLDRDDLVIPVFLSLLHAPRWGAALSRIESLIAWFETAIALEVLAAPRCPRGDASCNAERSRLRQLRVQITGAVRSGSQRLKVAIAAIAADTRHYEATHQALVGQTLTALTSLRAGWQRAGVIAGQAQAPAPSPTELEDFQRLQELIRRRRDLDAALRPDEAQRTQLRRLLNDDDSTRDERAGAREELAVLWPHILEQRGQRRDLTREIGTLRRQLGERTIERIRQYLAAQRAGFHRADAISERDAALRRFDARIGAHTPRRLSTLPEQQRWESYELLLELLLSNSYDMTIERFMNSLLNVEQIVERGRNIGLDAHRRGRVQWLTYPGHGDNAVDWNCAAGLPLTMEAPDTFTMPERYRSADVAAGPYTYQASRVESAASGLSDIQDIFAKLAYGLLGSADSGSEPLARLLRERGDSELAPRNVLLRRRNYREISNLLVGLLARNLTAVSNASEFDGLRRGIIRDIEEGVVRMRGLATGTVLFDRSRVHAHDGAFGIGRIVRNIRGGDLIRSVRDLLMPVSSEQYDVERTGLIHRIWQLLLWLRSAGAEPHRRAVSITVRHEYTESGSSGDPLNIDVYYTHMHRLTVRPSAAVARGDHIGLTGSTGNAVNSHVHIEIRLRRSGGVIGSCLPHEFFPLSPP